MIQYVIYGEKGENWELQNRDLYMNETVHIFTGFNNPMDFAYRIHNAWPLNKYGELPFKKIWYNRYFDKETINKEGTIYFIFNEGCHLSYSGKYLRYLKREYPGSKMCFVFMNPMDDYNLYKLSTVKKYYDGVVSFIPQDAASYGCLFYAGMYSEIDVPDCDIPESDLFFVGLDKGRLDRLLEIYERMTSLNMVCDFHICGVDKHDQKYPNIIHYNSPISYTQVIQHIKKTKCILEILKGDLNYTSLRTFEAITYHKKLITTNMGIMSESYYNPSVIQSFNRVDEIDFNFINQESDETDFSDTNQFSPSHFLTFVRENLR